MQPRSLAVLVLRGDTVESMHHVDAALCRIEGPGGAERFTTFGDPAGGAFWRSALKPFQALPVVEDGAAEAFGFGAEQLAIACASHGGRPEHVARVLEMMRALGIEERDLHCGPHAPYDEPSALAIACAGEHPGRVHNNCSGKHAAMLALVAHRGWNPDGYWRLDHPLQRRIREELTAWIDSDPEGLRWATDGCGVPTPFLSLQEMARAFARLGSRASAGESAPAAVVGAMMRHPELTSSPGREALVVMQTGAGRLLAKEGAEGVLCVAAPASGWGLALKVVDGTRRAVGPAVVALLAEGGLISDAERAALGPLAEPELVGTTGETVGRLRGVFGGDDRGGGGAL